jgi:GNAT superfamily N-acetyltransferase
MPAATDPQATPTGGELLTKAIESDRRYFELGAKLEGLGGAQLAWMPGLSTSPAAVVVHRVVPELVAVDPARWLDCVEARLRELRTPLARIYLDDRHPTLDALLTVRGFVDRDELALAGPEVHAPTDGATLRRIVDERGWSEKCRLHELDAVRPDGHQTAAQDWVALERAKAAGMESFLLEVGGETVGAVGAVRLPGILRMKNVLVHPEHRRKGLGATMLAHLADLARKEGRWGVCIFAVEGSAGERLYRSVGLQVVGRQVEWSRALA